MRAFDERHYRIVGYQHVSAGEDTTGNFWVLETICPESFDETTFQSMRILVKNAKYVTSCGVYILREDGTMLEPNINYRMM